MVFPYDFGFVPSTMADDGDPLDVLALLDALLGPGCVVRARPNRRDRSRAEDERAKGGNDRLLIGAVHARVHAAVRKTADLRPHVLRETRVFFDYNKLEDRKFRCLRVGGPKVVVRLIRAGAKLAKARV
jgi:inorganic pyrophosphatase